MNLSNTWYDRLKFFVQIVLPGLAALYVGLSDWWELPKPAAVAGTVALVATFLGLFLNQSAKGYDGAGDLVVHYDEADGTASLATDLNEDPAKFKDGQNVTFNVKRVDHAA